MKGYLVNYGSGYESTTEDRVVRALMDAYYKIEPLLKRMHDGEEIRTRYAIYRYQE